MISDVQKGKNIQSVQRAIDILNCFSSSNTELSLGEISDMLNLNKGTAHGIISTLYSNDYICQNRSGKYLLGPAIFSKSRYGQNTLMAIYADAARVQMQEMSNKYTATGNLFYCGEGFLQFVIDTEPRNTFFLLHKARPEMPMYSAASAKLYLAYKDDDEKERIISELEFNQLTQATITSPEVLKTHLFKIREQGYSCEEDEFFEGVSALSVPIFSNKEILFGMLSMTGMSSNIMRNLKEIVSDLKDISLDIKKAIIKFNDEK